VTRPPDLVAPTWRMDGVAAVPDDLRVLR